MAEARDIVLEIYHRYSRRYGHSLFGCEALVADEIQQTFGGEVVAGELCWDGPGLNCRSHWWVDLDGVVLDLSATI